MTYCTGSANRVNASAGGIVESGWGWLGGSCTSQSWVIVTKYDAILGDNTWQQATLPAAPIPQRAMQSVTAAHPVHPPTQQVATQQAMAGCTTCWVDCWAEGWHGVCYALARARY